MLGDGNLTALTAIEATEKIAGGEISAEAYTGACLDRIAAIEKKVRAFAHIDAERCAGAGPRARRAPPQRPRDWPVHGIPVGIKDIFDTADYKTEYGSPLLKGRQPMRDCTAVARLREAGAVIIGKTVTTEFAYFHPGPTRNPRDPNARPAAHRRGWRRQWRPEWCRWRSARRPTAR